MHLKIEHAVAQRDHSRCGKIDDRQDENGLFAADVEDLHIVCRDRFQHGDAGGERCEDRREEEQRADDRPGLAHGREDLRQRDEHQAGAGAHAVGAGKDKDSRDDHDACQQGDAGVKELDLARDLSRRINFPCSL